MNTHPFFDFTVNKDTQTVVITRSFAAGRDLVWSAFTQPELLDQWWAPKPMRSETKELNFTVGGRRFYAMVGPDGAERWSVQRYTAIEPKTHFAFFNAFADAEGNPQLPGSEWDLYFEDQGETTLVRISVYNESLERMEMILEGFKAGFTMTLGQLEEMLKGQTTEKAG